MTTFSIVCLGHLSHSFLIRSVQDETMGCDEICWMRSLSERVKENNIEKDLQQTVSWNMCWMEPAGRRVQTRVVALAILNLRMM